MMSWMGGINETMSHRDKLMMEDGGHKYRKLTSESMHEITKKGVEDSKFFQSSWIS